MTAVAWSDLLDGYLALRRAVGFSMRPEERLLRDFVASLEQRTSDSSTVAQIAVEWATTRAVRGGSHSQSRRLSVARMFLTVARATHPTIDVPGVALLRTPRRPAPHIYTPSEVTALMEACRTLGPRDALRPHTVATVIGLLASTGLRASEAIALTLRDVDLEATPPRVLVRQTKFRKSRLVPMHPTVADALRAYADDRHRLGYDDLCEAFFVSERGTRLNYHVLARAFVAVARRLGLRGPIGVRGASLHHVRHTFAVERLAAWSRAGGQVRHQLPALSVYLGHVRPQETYWYLTAAPQVLEPASQRFETYIEAKVRP